MVTVTSVRKCVEIRCFNLHVYWLSKTCWLPSVKILNLKFSDVEIWRQLGKIDEIQRPVCNTPGGFFKFHSKLSNPPSTLSRSISLPFADGGEVWSLWWTDHLSKMHLCLGKIKIRPPPKKNRFGRRFFLKPQKKRNGNGRTAWVGSVYGHKKKKADFSSEKAHLSFRSLQKWWWLLLLAHGSQSWVWGWVFAWDFGGTKTKHAIMNSHRKKVEEHDIRRDIWKKSSDMDLVDQPWKCFSPLSLEAMMMTRAMIIITFMRLQLNSGFTSGVGPRKKNRTKNHGPVQVSIFADLPSIFLACFFLQHVENTRFPPWDSTCLVVEACPVCTTFFARSLGMKPQSKRKTAGPPMTYGGLGVG